MAGSREGGLKARETNLKKYGKDFYRNIGRIGGANSFTGGFASNPELARKAGTLGGRKSKRGKNYYYTILRNSKGETPAFEILPKTAQGWQKFFSIKYPEKMPISLLNTHNHKRIIKGIEEVYKVQFKESKNAKNQ